MRRWDRCPWSRKRDVLARRALAVPLLMSTLLMLVLGRLLLRERGFLLVLAWLVAAALAQTPLGEWWTSRLFYAARRPMTHQRDTLAPVAETTCHKSRRLFHDRGHGAKGFAEPLSSRDQMRQAYSTATSSC